ncbi:hypothetical protein VTO73DRAFT_13039 [Trametes versicolor]
MSSKPSVLPDPRQEGRNFWQRFKDMDEWLRIPESDLGEMCIEFELGTGWNQTRWKRYQFSCIPVNTTLLFQQSVHALDRLAASAWMMRTLPDPSVVELYAHISIAPRRVYFTETTVTMCAHAAEQAASPLWFFLLQFDSGDHSAHESNIPCGFWSSEKDPASVPVDFIFDQTPQFVPIEEGEEAPLFTSTQALGDLVFTTQTKMYTAILQFSEDELLAFKAASQQTTTAVWTTPDKSIASS